MIFLPESIEENYLQSVIVAVSEAVVTCVEECDENASGAEELPSEEQCVDSCSKRLLRATYARLQTKIKAAITSEAATEPLRDAQPIDSQCNGSNPLRESWSVPLRSGSDLRATDPNFVQRAQALSMSKK